MPPRVFIRSLALLVITFAGILFYLFLIAPRQTTEIPGADNPYSAFYIPDFRLTDREGVEFDDSFLDGKITVVDFFYTSCPLICPGMTAVMRDIQYATEGTDVQLLSISIDPEVDTPDVLKTYANGFKADPERWRFARGTPEMTQILLMGVGFDLSALRMEDGFRVIDHPSSILLIGPDRHVIGLYRYSDPDEVGALIEKARDLAG